MGSVSEDPSVIRSVAISTEDLVAALESAQRSGRDAVLRVTPPFSGRMRARLHVEGADDYDDPEPVHIDPATLVAASAPTYPTPAETEDALRADPAVEYTRDRHHERHTEAVADWRASIPDHVVATATIDTSAGHHEIEVTLLG
ncbi:MAG: hypothetical protein ABEI77_07940 [Halorientalis sp.]